MRDQVKISIVATAFNEWENLQDLYDEICAALDGNTKDFEIVIVDNGSTDGSLQLLKTLRAADPRVGYVSLSRNFGHQGGLIAGLEHCRGGVVVTMDADLQHPPDTIVEMLDRWQEGFDVVGTVRRNDANTPRLRKMLNGLFYTLIRKSMGPETMSSQSDFRLMDRKALDALLALPEKDKFLRGLAGWVGFRQTSVSYTPRMRTAGSSKFTSAHLAAFTINGVVAFGVLPLRLLTIFGLFVATVALLYGLFVFVSAVLHGTGTLPPGWATLAIAVSFLGGIQLIGIGILGEYLGRTLGEVRARPAYVVCEAEIGNEVIDNEAIDK